MMVLQQQISFLKNYPVERLALAMLVLARGKSPTCFLSVDLPSSIGFCGNQCGVRLWLC
jgi:hypothetical protein